MRWLPSTIENAVGPHVRDPRTGEILESDIQMYHNIQNLQRSWYFTQVGPLDPRAATLPLPDDLMGTLIEYVVAHEVGHTLGFQHNMKSSSLYPVEKLRDPEWLKTMGHVATLMDYSRFNYVAQPEDKIDPKLLIPGIGPYDKFATMWGYKPIPGARTPDEERKTLDQWAREQDTTPWLRFSTSNSRGSDPGELTEAVGDGDAVQATTLGLKNLKRVADMLIPATNVAGEPYDDLERAVRAHARAVDARDEPRDRDRGRAQLAGEVRRAGRRAVHGGAEGEAGRRRRVPRPERVRDADMGAQARPPAAHRAQRRARSRAHGTGARAREPAVERAHRAHVGAGVASTASPRYAPTDMLNDVRKGIFSELDGAAVKVDPYRRNLQRAYIDLASLRVNAAQSSADDNRALFRGELRAVDAAAQAAAARTTDAETRRHLQDLRAEVAKALDPGRIPASTSAPSGPARTFDGDDAWGLTTPDTCWPDYVIRPGR